MREKRIWIVMILMCALIMTLSISKALDENDSAVWTDKDIYIVGETVTIYYRVTPDRTADNLILVMPDRSTETLITGPISGSGSYLYTPTDLGDYQLKLGPESISFYVAQSNFSVVPEVPLGTIGAIATFFGALGLTSVKQLRRKDKDKV
jgi:hypothetical protein